MQQTVRLMNMTGMEDCTTQYPYVDRNRLNMSFDRNTTMSMETEDSIVSETMLSQDLYSLIDSFYMETPVENFDNGDSEAFQCVIDDVIDAVPSSDDFNFLDQLAHTHSWDVPVKNNNSFVTGTSCIYTCANENELNSERMTCARTRSSTRNMNNTCDALSPAENGLLAELSEFLIDTDSGLSFKPSSCNIEKTNGRIDNANKRGHESFEMPSCKRSGDSQSFLDNLSDSDQNGNLYRETVCARGS